MSNLKRRAAMLLVALLAITGSLLAIQAPAHAAASARGSLFGPYTIRPSTSTWKCLDITNASQSNGAEAQTYDCLGSQQYNQVFYFWAVEGTSTWYQITPSHSWKCLDVTGVSLNDWAHVQQYSCLGQYQYNQVFSVYEISPGQWVIRPTHTQKYLNYSQASNGQVIYQHSNIATWNIYGLN